VQPEDWTRHAESFDIADPFDAETDALAHLPFTRQFQAAVALALADLVRAIRRTPPKVIAVDGDETLWGGVAGEVGPDAVDLTGPRQTLARRLLEWRAAGALLVLVSNNDEDTVLSVLQRPESVLRAEHFTAISATWGPKASRLEAIATSLGLGLDSFLFLDDNPIEIAAVRSSLPEVLSVTCPPASELEAFITRLWPVTPKPATREDAARADFYRQERLRTEAREQSSFADFLDRLELEVDIEPLSQATIERSVQLSRRTNQFNLRPTPLDEAALTRSQQDGEVWTATVRDRFGDYGQVGLLILRPDDDNEALEVMTWMLSCRALARGVEERLLQWLADRAEALGCSAVRLIAENTPRNIPARRLVSALGGGDVDSPRLDVAVPLSRLREFRSWDGRS
jgi:FkbH-like protein